ncbi:unnamed protein product [Angiostrongylus costaricensis]|uniref:Secreted protein n=1 Tax=Angiostrongylus costaricensis TaxID=334426 RepID=A0A0R3PH63_ANGCS|nr:unnamed protein product [Angiostrongylus costaricensis]
MRFAIVILVTIYTVMTCHLTAKLLSKSKRPLWAQMKFPNGTESDFESSDRNYTITISEPYCSLKPTIVTSYLTRPSTGVEPLGATSAFIDGMGFLEYLVKIFTDPLTSQRLCP